MFKNQIEDNSKKKKFLANLTVARFGYREAATMALNKLILLWFRFSHIDLMLPEDRKPISFKWSANCLFISINWSKVLFDKKFLYANDRLPFSAFSHCEIASDTATWSLGSPRANLYLAASTSLSFPTNTTYIIYK